MASDDQLDQQAMDFGIPSGKEHTEVSDDVDADQKSESRQDDPEVSEEKPEDFQVALERLKDVARELESGELPLEEAMDRYREGLGLIEFCEDRLEEAELLVEEIDDTEAGPVTREKEPPES